MEIDVIRIEDLLKEFKNRCEVVADGGPEDDEDWDVFTYNEGFADGMFLALKMLGVPIGGLETKEGQVMYKCPKCGNEESFEVHINFPMFMIDGDGCVKRNYVTTYDNTDIFECYQCGYTDNGFGFLVNDEDEATA